ncbi:MAG: hypothetical protein EKK45_15200 [Curvibacter sp.]|nr:MAG: hypothetical protein EKK45_15200 [Curvibacter sp.]
MQEHLSLDLGPIGLAARQLCSPHALAHIWNKYHSLGQVLAPSAMQCDPDGVRLSFQPSSGVSAVVELLAQAMSETFQSAVARNIHRQQSALRLGRPYSPEAGLGSVSELAKMFGMPALLVETCLFFEDEPRASVGDWIQQSGFAARRLERWFAEHSVTQQLLRRACCLVGASQAVLHGRETLGEIAWQFGFTDAAHLTRVFKRSSGGLAPGVFSGILLSDDIGDSPALAG